MSSRTSRYIATRRCSKCHQIFLAARSPVFKAMLQAEMKEKQSKKIVIEDFNPRTVAHMLKFMYTGDISVDDMEDLTMDLLRAADFYELDGLKEMCEETLCSNLSIENSIECLVLGDSCNASTLKKMALSEVWVENDRASNPLENLRLSSDRAGASGKPQNQRRSEKLPSQWPSGKTQHFLHSIIIIRIT